MNSNSGKLRRMLSNGTNSTSDQSNNMDDFYKRMRDGSSSQRSVSEMNSGTVRLGPHGEILRDGEPPRYSLNRNDPATQQVCEALESGERLLDVSYPDITGATVEQWQLSDGSTVPSEMARGLTQSGDLVRLGARGWQHKNWPVNSPSYREAREAVARETASRKAGEELVKQWEKQHEAQIRADRAMWPGGIKG